MSRIFWNILEWFRNVYKDSEWFRNVQKRGGFRAQWSTNCTQHHTAWPSPSDSKVSRKLPVPSWAPGHSPNSLSKDGARPLATNKEAASRIRSASVSVVCRWRMVSLPRSCRSRWSTLDTRMPSKVLRASIPETAAWPTLAQILSTSVRSPVFSTSVKRHPSSRSGDSEAFVDACRHGRTTVSMNRVYGAELHSKDLQANLRRSQDCSSVFPNAMRGSYCS